jgi:hypothetical protein
VPVDGAPECPHPGEEFFIFHRQFLSKLRKAYQAKGLTADISPWYAVPPEITADPDWTVADRAAEQALQTMIDPATGTRFASLEALGVFINKRFHGSLHIVGAKVYGVDKPPLTTADRVLMDVPVSPKSTYFFKVHGLVDYYFSRYLKGEFNRDGKSDVVIYRSSDHQRGFARMDGTTRTPGPFLIEPLPTGCSWYLGATADLDLNGSLDLIFHSPNCAKVIARLMSRDTPTTPIALPGGLVSLTGVGAAWTLIGSGDFDGDSRPDLVWSDGTRIDVWSMDNTTIIGERLYSIPAGYTPIITGDLDDNGHPDFLVRNAASDGGVDYYVMHGGVGAPVKLTGLTRSPYATPVAIGSYSGNDNATLGSQDRRQADLLFSISNPGAPFKTYSFALSTSATTLGTANYGISRALDNPLPNDWIYEGPK